MVEKIDLEVTPEELRNMIEPVFLEYFEHTDTKEVEVKIKMDILLFIILY